MKRCPQCEFIYPDRDTLCDFDQTPLVPATESEIAAITNTPERPALEELAATHSRKLELRRNRRALPLAVALGLLLALVAVAIYFAVHRRVTSRPLEAATSHVVDSHNIVSPSPSPSPSPSTNNSPSPELIASDVKTQTTTPQKSTVHSTTRLGPVSGGSPRTEGTSNAKPVILLTTGGRIEADAAWRTKDGVWYRRNGIVTLLKGNRVKGIVGQ
jgi:hypothetical protein